MEITNRVALVLAAAALGLGACGGEEEQHGADASEHTSEKPGQTTPHVAGHGTEEEGHAGEIGGSHGEAARGPGATDRNDLDLQLNPSALHAGHESEIGFKILDAGGEPITKFDVEHTKQVHLIVVSKDLRHFQHVHPKVSGHGTWRAAIKPGAPGPHRVIADVAHEGKKLALTADLEVGGDPVAAGKPAPEAKLEPQALQSGQPATLRFQAPGKTEPYLGAAGHLVVLHEDDLEYLHVHPRERELAFTTSFPKPGRYVMFLEYKRGGKVRVSRFEAEVA
jgi:hypothetical protein